MPNARDDSLHDSSLLHAVIQLVEHVNFALDFRVQQGTFPTTLLRIQTGGAENKLYIN